MENIDTDVKVQRVKRQIAEREKKGEAKGINLPIVVWSSLQVL